MNMNEQASSNVISTNTGILGLTLTDNTIKLTDGNNTQVGNQLTNNSLQNCVQQPFYQYYPYNPYNTYNYSYPGYPWQIRQAKNGFILQTPSGEQVFTTPEEVGKFITKELKSLQPKDKKEKE